MTEYEVRKIAKEVAREEISDNESSSGVVFISYALMAAIWYAFADIDTMRIAAKVWLLKP